MHLHDWQGLWPFDFQQEFKAGVKADDAAMKANRCNFILPQPLFDGTFQVNNLTPNLQPRLAYAQVAPRAQLTHAAVGSCEASSGSVRIVSRRDWLVGAVVVGSIHPLAEKSSPQSLVGP